MMRRRLKNFLPIVLIALAVQVFAPIAACWTAAIAASNPLQAATICHGNSVGAGQDDQSGGKDVRNGCCGLCGVLHPGAPLEPPQSAFAVAIDRPATLVVWHRFAIEPVTSRAGSPEQARAPPSLS
jgi:hypothetical protein